MYTNTIEKLEQVPPDERRGLIADVDSVWKERHIQGIATGQQPVQHPPTQALSFLYESQRPGNLFDDLMDTGTGGDDSPGGPVKLPDREDILDDLWDAETERYEKARLAQRAQDHCPSMQSQLDDAVRETAQLNAGRTPDTPKLLETGREI